MSENKAREEMLDRIEQRAMTTAPEWQHCAQATLSALTEEFNIPGAEDALKAATFMAGGTAELGNTCGAFNGGIMALGLVAGRKQVSEPKFGGTEINELTGHEKRLDYAVEFYNRFIQANGTWLCRDIIMRHFGRQFDLLNNHDSFVEAGSRELCPRVVGQAARLAAEIILKMRDEGLIK